MKRLTIGKQIAIGFIVIWLTLVSTVLVTLYQVKELNAISERIVYQRIPVAEGSLQMLNGLRHTLSALRGWMILGENEFRAERGEAWETIDGSYARIHELINDSTQLSKLDDLVEVLRELKQVQDEIEQIVHTSDNIPAGKKLDAEALPLAARMVDNITRLIDMELTQPAADERKRMFKTMADLRATLALATASVQAVMLSGTPDDIHDFQSRWTRNRDHLQALREYTTLLTPDQSRLFEDYRRDWEKLDLLLPELIKMRQTENWNVANHMLQTRAVPAAVEIRESLRSIWQDQAQLREADLEVSRRKSLHLERSEWMLLIFGMIVSIGAGLAISYSFRNSLVNPINEVIGSLTEGSEQVAAASGQVAESSQKMAEGTSEQASGLEEVSSSLEELTSMTRQNADNANKANEMVNDVQFNTDKAKDAMNRMNDAVAKIRDSAEQTVIIVKTIDEIAFQTNLLALNAAVEAARAGDAGRGFAVVAEEVRNLAQRSAEAARNTAKLIEESRGSAEKGVSVSTEVDEILSQISERIGRMTQLMGEVVAASDEQAQGIDQINTAITQMDRVTQSNAANSEESASASEELSAKAQELNSMVSVLTDALASVVGGNGELRGDYRMRGAVVGTPPRTGAGGHWHTQQPTRALHHGNGRPSGDGDFGRNGNSQPDSRRRKPRKPEMVIQLDDDDLRDF